jgi:hypothetical protein
VTMKASALSAAIPILGRSAEDRKQMKRADPFGLVLRVGSVQQVDLPEPGQAVKDVCRARAAERARLRAVRRRAKTLGRLRSSRRPAPGQREAG